MLRRTLALALLLTTLLPSAFAQRRAARTREVAATQAAANVPAPEDVLGFRPGDDRKLASWSEVVEYFRRLDAASTRVKLEELGKTTMGAPFVLATISAPENLRRLNEFKEIQRQLADPRTLGRDPDGRARRLISRGKTIVLITCGIHSTEVGSTLSSMLIAHRLASSDDAEVQRILQDSIILLVPSLNPDGVDIVKNWYDRTLGTPFEGTDPPVLYHKYTGHDNNRDWYAFTQVETQLTVARIHNVWHPQIVHDIHQQGIYGSRLFLPPYMQPVEPNVPRPIIEGYTELGQAMAAELRAAGFKGITNNSTYDAWTPARAYSHYHGGVRILSETASAKIATPVNLKFEELRARSEGYDPQKESDNFGPVWRGGEWRLRDITSYMTTAAFSLMKHAAENRERWLERFYEIGKEAVRPRRKGELFGFEIQVTPSSSSSDLNVRKLVEILKAGGVEVEQGFAPGFETPREIVFVKMAQPYGGFAKALLETQRYPDLRDTSGHPISPYDVTAHTLPLLMGVEARPVYAPLKGFRRGFNNMYSVTTRVELKATRVGLYKSHTPTMDEGWTRWVLEHGAASGVTFRGRTDEMVAGPFKLPAKTVEFSPDALQVKYTSIEDAEIRRGKLRDRYDAIIIPDQSANAILNGHKPGAMPAEYTGGLGSQGVRSLREFVEEGGTLIFLNRASAFATEQFKLPVRDVTEGLKRTEFFVPGSILRIELDTSHPITKGMPKESIAWAENSPAFEIKSEPAALARVRVIARYPEKSDPLLSGWLLGGERIKGKAALVEVGMGKGRIYLFGFRPQYRAQSLASYPLFFNALSTAGGN